MPYPGCFLFIFVDINDRSVLFFKLFKPKTCGRRNSDLFLGERSVNKNFLL